MRGPRDVHDVSWDIGMLLFSFFIYLTKFSLVLGTTSNDRGNGTQTTCQTLHVVWVLGKCFFFLHPFFELTNVLLVLYISNDEKNGPTSTTFFSMTTTTGDDQGMNGVTNGPNDEMVFRCMALGLRHTATRLKP